MMEDFLATGEPQVPSQGERLHMCLQDLHSCHRACTIFLERIHVRGCRAAFYGETETLLEYLKSCKEEELLQHDSQGNTVSTPPLIMS